jgi:hypothetical protein
VLIELNTHVCPEANTFMWVCIWVEDLFEKELLGDWYECHKDWDLSVQCTLTRLMSSVLKLLAVLSEE